MTTFDAPDASLLVEHLLPSLVGTTHSLSSETQERSLFFGELGSVLEALHGRLTIISSPPREERAPAHYPWLWRYASHFMVGSKSRAVQHSKLWAFHWRGADNEMLELHISSANLTSSAFKDQVQAGWRVVLPLDTATASARRSWGTLVSFLDALGLSAGAEAMTRVQRLIGLLNRVHCPPDVHFIASIPGDRSAARQLRTFAPSEVHILTPTIGDWSRRTLSSWSKDLGIDPAAIHVKWIDTEHPWAAADGWSLTAKSKAALDEGKVKIERIASATRFVAHHHAADPRWSHAKIYLLRNGRKRRLVVSSANWSASAWGAGSISPRNFELGVALDCGWMDLEGIRDTFEPPRSVPFCVDGPREQERTSSLEWAQATWDGRSIQLIVRSSDALTPINARISFSGPVDCDVPLHHCAAVAAWNHPEHPPLAAQFSQGTCTLEVHIVDLRRPSEFARTPLPELDPALGERFREAFLLQRYGGPAVDGGHIVTAPDESPMQRASTPAASYSLAEWIEARRGFEIIDQWSAALEASDSDPMLRERILTDGQGLHTVFARGGGPSAKLVAEELRWRLEAQA